MRTSCKTLSLPRGPILALVIPNRHLSVPVEPVSCCKPFPLQRRTAKTACVSKFARWTARHSFLVARHEKPGPRTWHAHGWRPPLLSLEPEVALDPARESRLCISSAIDFQPSATPGRASSRLCSEFYTELTHR